MGYSDTDEEAAAKAALENVSPGRSGATGHGAGKESPGVNNVMRKDGGAKVLPFDFKALEVCLESPCRCLESELRGSMLTTRRVISTSCWMRNRTNCYRWELCSAQQPWLSLQVYQLCVCLA